ncbi:ABC transporter ATP-binding protein [Arthrobacter sp. HY1533]|uniref:ABC transporter ATP-binding protein n=1 Tax=Arthrobacter sp. HY1533 TaxID=2970919 RepID=UPI0022B9F1B7|nr:ATP-binding cassette domain-containing protein [Arthrobacter sp. HY1533]
MSSSPSSAILQIRDLHVSFPVRGFRKEPIRVIRGVSLDIAPGETVGLVGESGSGKTTIGRAVLGLAPVTSGSITFQGKDLGQMSPRERRRSAKDIQAVFQDPYSSLNPAMTIEDILSEPLQGVDRRQGREKVRSLLESVNLPGNAGQRLAREFSGGQRQRIAIARALALSPKLIICDEPTSALDLSTQARVLDLFLEIQERTGVAYLFITHDLAVVRRMSHRIAVLFHGAVAEIGTARQISEQPEHPYTQRLLMAAPVANPLEQERRRAERRRLLDLQDQQIEQGGGNKDMWVA